MPISHNNKNLLVQLQQMDTSTHSPPVAFAIRRRSIFLHRRTAIVPLSTKYFRHRSSMPPVVRMTLAPADRIFWMRSLVMSASLQTNHMVLTACSTLPINIYIYCTHTRTHTRLAALCPELPGWASTRKVKPIWILLKQEIKWQWATCKSAPRSIQITTPLLWRKSIYKYQHIQYQSVHDAVSVTAVSMLWP